MASPLDELQQLLPIPPNPRFTQGDWNAVEQQLGLRLPTDYKEFISVYGSGSIAAFFYVNNLLESPRVALNEAGHLRYMQDSVFGELQHVAEIMKRPPESVSPPVPFPIYPELEGLFPWGQAQDGWTFWWHRKGEPQDWDIVVLENWIESYYRFPATTMVRFVIDLFRHPFVPRLQLSPLFEVA